MEAADRRKAQDTHWFELVAATKRSQPGGAARASLLSKVATIMTPASTSRAKPHNKTYPDLPEWRKLKKLDTTESRAAAACWTIRIAMSLTAHHGTMLEPRLAKYFYWNRKDESSAADSC